MTRRRVATLGLLGLALLLAALLVQRALHDPAQAVLLNEGGAEWIRWDEPPFPGAHWSRNRSTSFRVELEIGAVPERAILAVKAFRSWGIFINQKRLERGAREPAPWIRAERVDLAPVLRPGRNELVLTVDNANGPPALLAYSEDLDLFTDATWMALSGAGPWSPAAAIVPHPSFPISREVGTSASGLLASLPELALVFALGCAASWLLGRSGRTLRADRLRFLLLGAFGLLCANNIARIGVGVGFDVRSHYEYIAYITQYGRLPLADDGWQMFQPPLFYLLCAPLFELLPSFTTMANTLLALRVVPMLCGLGLIEICFRASRIAYPDRNDLQLIGTLVGGLLPMNLYISQVVGNEPLAGLLTALLVCLALRLAAAREEVSPVRASMRLGLVLGLAVLAKVTAVILVPVLLLLIGSLTLPRRGGRRAEAWREGAYRGRAWREAARAGAGLLLVAAGVAGWYYARNWIVLGRPFVGGWATDRGHTWWQDPGFRVPADLLSFGESLVHPVYSSAHGFWDGLYASFWLDGHLSAVRSFANAPPWSIDHMLSMALLSIPMTLALALGIARAFSMAPGPARRVGRLAVACVATYLAAMLALYVRVPSYSAVKATYALGLAPCFALLIASGFAPLARGRLGRALVSGYLCSWGAIGYLAFFASWEEPSPDLLILVSIDTLRADHLGCYGYERPTSPVLDAIAEEGVVFEDVTSPAPWTLPAHASMLTGLYPRRHGVRLLEQRLASGVPTLATRLADRGWTTAAIVSNDYLGDRYGLEQGFEVFVSMPTSVKQASPSTLVTDQVIGWLQKSRQKPLFLFVHYYDVHSDYRSLPENEARFVGAYAGGIDGSTEQLLEVKRGERVLDRADADHLVDLYDAGVRQMDTELGRLVDFLHEHGLEGRALLIVTSDHGEEFLEHGSVLHGQTQFREVSRVPWLVRGPGVPRGARVETPVSLVDLVPTALALLGEGQAVGLDGVDASGLWRAGGEDPAERPLFAEADRGREQDANHSVRRGSFVLHLHRPSGSHRLHDLRSDPAEQVDVSAEHPELARELRAILRNRVGDAAAPEPARELSPDEAERLRGLGYLF